MNKENEQVFVAIQLDDDFNPKTDESWLTLPVQHKPQILLALSIGAFIGASPDHVRVQNWL